MNRTKLYKAILLILFTPIVAYTSIAKGNDCAVSTTPVSKDSVICGTSANSHVNEGIAIGKNASVNDQKATNSIAVGNNTTVNAASSVALGNNSYVNPGATNSIALGDSSLANESYVVSIGNKSTNVTRKIIYLTSGEISKNSTDAVNGGQLFGIKQKVEGNTNTIKDHGINLIKFSKNNNIISVADAANAPAVFNFNKQNITGVGDGDLSQSSTDAVNGGQLHKVNKKANDNAAEIIKIMATTGAGLVQLSDDHKKVVFSDYVKSATTFNVGDRNITGAKQGEISQSSTDVITGSQLHATNKLVDTNTSNIADHTSKIANNTKQLADHTSKIANNTKQLADHTSKIANNTHQLADHTSKIANNTDRIDSLENKVRSVDSELGRMDKKIDRGLAMSAAMNGLFQPYGVGNINMSVAFGGYGDHQAVAVGSGYRVNENVAFKAAVSTSGSSKTMYNAGVNIEW
ncbi:YadA-like family protein [Xenorhabdus sp. BG5]|uniref:YadA-like family protein n=1 Tax=Xenorhabdus sp. BG5 TaxID=2782014 RepID=UPI00187F1EE2|nr:YadA-like family protein [Xenorhabdus sp. BG5]MBE8596279.1 YadA-like family protein [Xenorhabdus sp. BG5]